MPKKNESVSDQAPQPSKAEATAKRPAKKAATKPTPKPVAKALVPKRAEWHLRLYIAGNTARSAAALENLKRICEEHLAGRYDIEVVDLLVNPQLAAGDQILAVPTLVRKFPEPMRKIIGDLSNIERVLVGLDVKPA